MSLGHSPFAVSAAAKTGAASAGKFLKDAILYVKQ
jgi:hypothetical protein